MADIFARAAAAWSGPDLDQVADLLTRGGDERIEIDPSTGLNAYGCGPSPQSDVLEFSSSTTSTISAAALEWAAHLYRANRDGAGLHEAAAEVRRRLARLCGLPTEAADDIVLAASGTDLHLIAAALARGASAQPLVSIMPDPRESGRGVPKALAGLPFAARPVFGPLTDPAPEALGEVVSIPLREPDGTLRSTDFVDEEVATACARAVRARRNVLIVVLDISKTGLVGPSAACAAEMKRRFGDAVEVLVDACQFRLSPRTLHEHLARGFLVAVTGSKFLGGPAFSGALLIPPAAAGRLRSAPPARVLADHCSRAEWPAAYAARSFLPDVANPGLLLRWEAALHELAVFREADPARVASVLDRAAWVIDGRLDADPAFERLPRPSLQRGSADSWDAKSTIFPFLMRRGGRLLNAAATRWAYEAASDPARAVRPVRFGQPVAIGRREGGEITALRLAFSAGQLARATASSSAAAALEASIHQALDTAAAVVGG